MREPAHPAPHNLVVRLALNLTSPTQLSGCPPVHCARARALSPPRPHHHHHHPQDRLVEYDRESAKRTTVYDDQADFFEIDANAWLTGGAGGCGWCSGRGAATRRACRCFPPPCGVSLLRAGL